MSHENSVISFFAKLIEENTGIVYSETNLYQLKARLEDFMRVEKILLLSELHQRVSQDTKLKERILDLATNNETLFFRDRNFYIAIEQFLKEIISKRPPEIRIWSCASSTGQEPLSISMLIEEIGAVLPLPKISILATDISPRALNRAKSGVYSEFEVNRGLSDERKNNFFSRTPEGWKVKDRVSSRIQYQMHNLLDPPLRYQYFDLVLCRNVLIYQNVERKTEIVKRLMMSLNANGLMVLGAGETMLGITDELDAKYFASVPLYHRKKAA